MERRAFLTMVAASVLTTPLAIDAQPVGKVYRLGYLSVGSSTLNSPNAEAFRQGLRDLGWVEGQNLVMEFRSANQFDRLPALATELVRLKVDIIVAMSYSVGADIFGKDLELLTEAVPKVRRVAVLSNPDGPSQQLILDNIKTAARSLALQLLPVGALRPGDFDAAFATMARERVGALFVVTDPTYIAHRSRLVDLATRNRLPSMFTQRADVEAGGLMSYGPSFAAMYRRAAYSVDKILKGAKPADLPIEQPTKFELVINLKTAKALGLTIPPSLLARADQVIE